MATPRGERVWPPGLIASPPHIFPAILLLRLVGVDGQSRNGVGAREGSLLFPKGDEFRAVRYHHGPPPSSSCGAVQVAVKANYCLGQGLVLMTPTS